MYHVILILKKSLKELEIKVIKWAFGRQEMAYKTIINFYECLFYIYKKKLYTFIHKFIF
jgi:glutamine amidotransferase PdxT